MATLWIGTTPDGCVQYVPQPLIGHLLCYYANMETTKTFDEIWNEVASDHGLDPLEDITQIQDILMEYAADPKTPGVLLEAMSKEMTLQPTVAANSAVEDDLLERIVTDYQEDGPDDWETETRAAMNWNAGSGTVETIARSVLGHPFATPRQLAEYAEECPFVFYDGPWQVLVAVLISNETDDTVRAATRQRIEEATRIRGGTDRFEKQLVDNLLAVADEHDNPDHDQVDWVHSWLKRKTVSE